MNRRDCLKTVAILVCIPYLPLTFAEVIPETSNIQRQLRFTLKLSNPNSYELTNQVLWLYMPVAETANQTLSTIHVSMPYKQEPDILGQAIITLSFPKLPPLSTKMLSVEANVILTQEPKPQSLANPKEWLGKERYIETTDPNIQALAKQLKRKEPRETALAIYEWSTQNIAYPGYIADDLGAAYALKNRQGDCTEYAYLAVALARANGIPARMVGGYNIDNNAILKATDYHNWAELYFDGAWRLLDAQKQRWLTPAENYIAFHYYKGQPFNSIGLAHRYSQQGEFEVSF